jgi:hypothetical protein
MKILHSYVLLNAKFVIVWRCQAYDLDHAHLRLNALRGKKNVGEILMSFADFKDQFCGQMKERFADTDLDDFEMPLNSVSLTRHYKVENGKIIDENETSLSN